MTSRQRLTEKQAAPGDMPIGCSTCTWSSDPQTDRISPTDVARLLLTVTELHSQTGDGHTRVPTEQLNMEEGVLFQRLLLSTF